MHEYTPNISKAVILDKNISSNFIIEYQQIILLIICLWTLFFLRYFFLKNIKSIIINISLDIVLFIIIWLIVFIFNNNYSLIIVILLISFFMYLKKKLLINSWFIKSHNYYLNEIISFLFPIIIYFVFSYLYFLVKLL